MIENGLEARRTKHDRPGSEVTEWAIIVDGVEQALLTPDQGRAVIALTTKTLMVYETKVSVAARNFLTHLTSGPWSVDEDEFDEETLGAYILLRKALDDAGIAQPE